MADDSVLHTRTDDVRLPLLLLVARNGPPGKPGREWLHLRHQCGGLGCHQLELYGTPVIPRGAIAMGLAQIAAYWLDSNAGTWGTHLDELLVYRRQLQELGLDCGYSYPEFREGVYPIDLPEDLGTLLEDQLPDRLDDLLDWPADDSGLARMCGTLNRWGLLLLGPNSD